MDIYHSRLLKYIVPHSKLFSMTEETKYKFEYKNPDNIESEVPGEQIIREATETSIKGTEDKTDFTFVPVMTVTKEETALTKGDMKLQKVLVTEDIAEDPETNIGMITIINPLFSEVLGQVIPGPHKMRENENNLCEKSNEEAKAVKEVNKEDQKLKPKSRLPVSKFKHAVHKMTKESKILKEKDKKSEKDVKTDTPEVPPAIVKRRSSIPRLKKGTRIEKSETPEVIQKKQNQSEPEDEFDKIYDAIADKERPQSIVDIVSPIDDPIKLENKFEEIVHDYEENNVHPINIESPKHSKIPLLKRRSDHDIDVPKYIRQTSLTKNTKFDDHNYKKSIKKVIEIEIKSDDKIKIKSPEKQETSLSVLNRVPNNVTTQKVKEVLPGDLIIEINGITHESTENNTRNLNFEPVENLQKDNITKKEITDSPTVKKSIESPTEITKTMNKDIFNRLDSKSNIPLPKFREQNDEFYDTKTDIVTKKFTRENSFHDRKDDAFGRNVKDESSAIPLKERFKLMADKYLDNSEVKTSQNTSLTKQELGKSNVNNKEHPKNITKVNKIEDKLKHLVHESPSKDLNFNSISVKNNELNLNEFVSAEVDKINTEISSEIKIESTLNESKSITIQDKILSSPGRDVDVEEQANNNMEKGRKDNICTAIENKESVYNAPTISEDHNFQISEQKHIEITPSKIVKSKIDIDEDPPILKGKVGRLISRLHSLEPQQEVKKENIEKQKSILAKIAIFERVEPKETYSKKIPPPKEKVIAKPKIVHELLKPKSVPNKLDTYDTNSKADIDQPNLLNREVENVQNTVIEQVVLPDIFKEEAVLYEKLGINEIGKQIEKIYDQNIESEIEKSQILEDRSIKRVHDEVENKIQNDTVSIILTKEDYKPHPLFKECDTNNEINASEFQKSIESDSNTTNNISKPKSEKDTRIFTSQQSKIYVPKSEEPEDSNLKRVKSLAELDLGDVVKGKVKEMIVRMNSMEQLDIVDKKEVINIKERPVKMSVLEKIALFERKSTLIQTDSRRDIRNKRSQLNLQEMALSEEEYQERIKELTNAKITYGRMEEMNYVQLKDGFEMPILILGTALLDPRLLPYVVATAIDLGYRAIDCAYIYGNEKLVGEAIKSKINDGTVRREELFVINKLWSTYHRPDLVEEACRRSLETMGLDYFDLYLIHNPMSFKEGADPVPKIANVVQYSDYDFMDAWLAMEVLVAKDLVRSIGVSNFNTSQLIRVLHKAKIPCVVNQVECHPYLTQQRLDEYCTFNDIVLTSFGVLGSKGTPKDLKSDLPPVIDDPLVQVMAAGLKLTPAQLLVRYQIECHHTVIVKSTSGAHLWDLLQVLSVTLGDAEVKALQALNKNKRTFTFKGMGDTHKNYPFAETIFPKK